jgi:enamine deaminase RidA (YjgF/YER057c/UK114 family)
MGANVTITVVKSGVPRPLANYNEAFVVGDLVFAAGQLASDFKTGVPPEARKQEGFPFYGSDIELQTTYILENLKKTFEAAGSSLEHVVKAQVFLTDLDHFHGFDTVWKRYFKVPPPRTTIGCTGLLVADTLVEIDLIGYVPRNGLKHDVVTSSIPRPLANYNEAVTVGDLVFAAGQLASDFKTGVPPQARKGTGFPFYGSDIELQTAYILENLKKTFEAAGSSLDQVLKAQVFLTDLDHFHGFDTVWKRYFKDRVSLGSRSQARGRQIGGSASARALQRGLHLRQPCFRSWSDRERLSHWRAAGGAQAEGLSVLRLRHRTADGIRPRQPEKNLRGSRLLARSSGQGAGVSHRPQQLPWLRYGVEALFQAAAAAYHHRLHGAVGRGYAGRDRSHWCKELGRVLIKLLIHVRFRVIRTLS